jgi:hypothetical protein
MNEKRQNSSLRAVDDLLELVQQMTREDHYPGARLDKVRNAYLNLPQEGRAAFFYPSFSWV